VRRLWPHKSLHATKAAGRHPDRSVKAVHQAFTQGLVPRTGLDDCRNAVGVQKRTIILDGVRKATESRDRFRRRRTLIQNHPHDQVS
jgi:hypothetical protein